MNCRKFNGALAIALCFLFVVSCVGEQLRPAGLVTGIALNKTTLFLMEGEEFTLIPTVTPDNAVDKSVNWASDNEAIAIVSNDGVVKALKAGKTIVTATTVDQGKTASCSIEVVEGMGAVTGAATHISCRNAEIAGKANLSPTTSTNLTFGILYSTSSGVLVSSATKIEARSFDSNYNYTVNTEVLEPETIYYYRSYIIQNAEINYGEVKSFKTLAVSSMIQTLDVTDINPKDVVLHASFDLTDCKYEELEYGFEVTPEGGTMHTIKSNNHFEKKFSAKDESLSSETKYSVVAYVKLDGRIYKGETKNFSTISVRASVTAEASAISYHSATISGKLMIESDGTFTKSAILYYSSTANTLEALKSSGTMKALTLDSDGSYSIGAHSLSSNSQYYYVVISNVDKIECRTEIKSFKTLKIMASISAESSNISYHSATISGKLIIESEGSFSTSAVLYYSSTSSTLDVLKSNGTEKSLTLGNDGVFSIIVDDFSIKTKHYYCVVVKIDDAEFVSSINTLTTLDYKMPDLVDLGLSVKWASFNLGATKPEDYGGYYQWAGTTDVSDKNIYLDWSNCPYHTGSKWSTGWTKYITSSYSPYWSGSGSPDNKTVLDLEDDVAHFALGGKWRMPTREEFEELYHNCTSQLTTVNGINGRKFTSTINHNSIFLPMAGYRLNDNANVVGSVGHYWSSSLCRNPKDAHDVSFYGIYVDTYDWERCYGLSVRPVSD